METPVNQNIAIFAQTNFRNRIRRFGILKDDRRRHMYIIGKTGMGKTTLIENLIVSDIYAGNGVAVVDPHGDMAETIMAHIPSHRVNDVVYFNPSDTEFPIGFNILEEVNPDYRHLVANGLVGVFKKIWADSWGPRLEYILMNTILALIEYPGSTLLGVLRMLVDKVYRKKVVSAVRDPMVRSFWENEYANYNDKFRSEAIAPIQNKVGQFLSSSIIRNIVGQPKSTINLRELMDSRKILIMNLSKGRIGEENSALLGAMMITRIQLAAMSRANIPEEDRKDFYLYVDEFQNFATESFADILSEARKYRLNLVMAHQYIEQLDETVAAAVFGNVGTMIVFRVGASDAESLLIEFEPVFDEQALVNITKYQVILKLMINGVSSRPFSAVTLPPLHSPTGNHDKVIAVSRERFARPKAAVEERILRWSGILPERETSPGDGAAPPVFEQAAPRAPTVPTPTARPMTTPTMTRTPPVRSQMPPPRLRPMSPSSARPLREPQQQPSSEMRLSDRPSRSDSAQPAELPLTSAVKQHENQMEEKKKRRRHRRPRGNESRKDAIASPAQSPPKDPERRSAQPSVTAPPSPPAPTPPHGAQSLTQGQKIRFDS